MADAQWNSPPGWPTPPAGWSPPPGWSPSRSWPPPPPGWQWWVPATRARSSVPSYLLGAAAAVLALCPFLSWIDAIFIGSVSLVDIFRLDGDSPALVYAATFALLLLAILAFTRVPGASIFGLLAGLGTLLYVADIIANASSVIGDAGGAVRLGAGAYVAAFAALAVLVTSIAAMTQSRF